MEVKTNPTHQNNVISVRELSKKFANKTIHRSVSFDVRNGECLGLLGGSGSGKSVILRSLIGLEKPDSGVIRIDNTDIMQMGEEQLFSIRKRVAYVFQNGALFDSMTVFDNIAYPLREHTVFTEEEISARVLELLGNFNLTGSDQLMPSELSGGMLKRVGLARAIALKPMIVLYDEPTAGLDPANTKTICELMLKLKSTGVSSILVTHDMESALAVCDRICFLRDGGLIDLGSTCEIKRHEQDLSDLFLKNGGLNE